MTSDPGTVTVRQVDDVTVLTLVRPEAENRITSPMAETAAAALEQARTDTATVGCVLTGHGNVFCAGGDFRAAGRGTAGQLRFGRAHNDLAQAMARLGKPLVAAVNGPALAGGFAMVTLCDLAVCANDATLGLPEASRGLFPLLALTIVKDSLPQKVFFDLVYRSRLLSAAQAQALNLVNDVVPADQVLDRAIEMARSMQHANADIVGIGRDLYYATRCIAPVEANEQARFALVAALQALNESDKAE